MDQTDQTKIESTVEDSWVKEVDIDPEMVKAYKEGFGTGEGKHYAISKIEEREPVGMVQNKISERINPKI